ncbi:MAG: DNA-3-methyladenine glycosylase [Burkholderiales bacterium]|nr:DNA-3-methyladenine glycosylase [Burkholderiales bacterium]
MRPLTFDDFSGDAPHVARAMIGATLLVDSVGGIIVETEAYDTGDPASHCHPGETPRNRAMFGPPGHAYVYRSYGVHWCLNFVCREADHGAGVLIRALQPTHGLAVMRERRGLLNEGADDRLLCAGPGRVGQALGITQQHYGLPLTAPPFAVLAAPVGIDVLQGTRIGISKAVALPWRFGLAGSPYLSRRFK